MLKTRRLLYCCYGFATLCYVFVSIRPRRNLGEGEPRGGERRRTSKSSFRGSVCGARQTGILGISRKFLGIRRKFPEISRKCPGNVSEISRKCTGHFPDISRKFPEHFPEISRKCPKSFLGNPTRNFLVCLTTPQQSNSRFEFCR